MLTLPYTNAQLPRGSRIPLSLGMAFHTRLGVKKLASFGNKHFLDESDSNHEFCSIRLAQQSNTSKPFQAVR